MRRVAILSCLSFVLAAGCATPPQADPEYAATTHRVQLASASMETGGAATLPVEPDLQGTHDVDDYVRIALERNPKILAARREVAAQVQVIPQATALDDPMLTDSFMPIANNSVQTAAGRGVNMLSLSQRFPWFGKLRVRGEVAEQQAKIALARFAQSQLEVIEQVKRSYFELYFTQRAIAITEADRKLIVNIVEFVNARYKTNRAPLQDLLRARIELGKVDDRLLALRRQFRQAQADLAKDLHTAPEADLLAAKSLPAESAPQQIERLYEAAVRCRPELQQRLHAIIRDQRNRELARLKYYPDVTVGMGWQAITDNNALSPIANGNDNVAFTIGMNLPIWQDKLRAGVHQAEQRVVASARQYDTVRDDTFRHIRRLLVQARSLEEQAGLFRKDIIPDAERTVSILFARYRSQQADIQDILDNYSRLLTYHVQLIRLEANLGQTLASLERVVGCQLATFEEPARSSAAPSVPPAPAKPKPTDEKPAAKEKAPASSAANRPKAD